MANDDKFWDRIRSKKKTLDERFERAVEGGYEEAYGPERAGGREPTRGPADTVEWEGGPSAKVGRRTIRPETFYSYRNYLAIAFIPVIIAFLILEVNALAVVSQLWLLTIGYFWLRGGLAKRSQRSRAIAIMSSLAIFFVVIIASSTFFGLDVVMLLWDIPFLAGLFVSQLGYEKRSSTLSGIGAVLLGGPLLIFLFISGLGLNVLILGYSLFAAALSFYFSAGESVFYKIFTFTTFFVWIGAWTNVILSMLAGEFLNLGFATMAIAAILTTVYMLQGSGRGDETAGGGGNLIAVFEILYGGFHRIMAVSGLAHDRVFLVGLTILWFGFLGVLGYMAGIFTGISEFIAVWGLFLGSLVLGPIHVYKVMHHGVSGLHEGYRYNQEVSVGGTAGQLRAAVEELEDALADYPDRSFEMGTEAWKVRKQMEDSDLPAIRREAERIHNELDRERGSTTRGERKQWMNDLENLKEELRHFYHDAQTLAALMEESENWSEDEVRDFDERVSEEYSTITTITQRLLKR